MFKRIFIIIAVVAFQLSAQSSATCDVCSQAVTVWNKCSGGTYDINEKLMECLCTQPNMDNYNACYNCEVGQGDWPAEYPTPDQALAKCQSYGFLPSATLTSATKPTTETGSIIGSYPTASKNSTTTETPTISGSSQKPSSSDRTHISLIVYTFVVGGITLGFFI